ncbi:MAG: SRPBCC family protein [Bacteroidota bacterium]
MKQLIFSSFLVVIFMTGCATDGKNEGDAVSEEGRLSIETVSKEGITNTAIINANADDVWSILRELDNIDQFSSSVAKVEWTGEKGVGGQRVCTTPDGKSTFTENITAFNDQNRTYSYAVVEGVPAKGLVNTFKVVNLGFRKSAIVWSSKYDSFIENPDMDQDQFINFVDSSSKEMIANLAKSVQ